MTALENICKEIEREEELLTLRYCYIDKLASQGQSRLEIVRHLQDMCCVLVCGCSLDRDH